MLVDGEGKLKNIFDYQREVLEIIDEYPNRREVNLSEQRKRLLEQIRKIL